MDEGAASAAAPVLRSTLLSWRNVGAPQRQGGRQSGQLFLNTRRPAANVLRTATRFLAGMGGSLFWGPHDLLGSSCRPCLPAARIASALFMPSVANRGHDPGRSLCPNALLALALGRRSGFPPCPGCRWGPPLPPCCARSLGWLLMPAIGGKNCCSRRPLLPPSAGGGRPGGSRSPGALEPWVAVCESTTPWRGAPGTGQRQEGVP